MSLVKAPPVRCRCPHCGKINPEIAAEVWGESGDSLMVVFVPHCCKKIIATQLIAKAANMNMEAKPDEAPLPV